MLKVFLPLIDFHTKPYIHTFTNISMYSFIPCTDIPSYIHTYLQCMHTYFPDKLTCKHTYTPTYIHTYIHIRVVSKEKHVEVERALEKGMRLNYFPLLNNALRYIERMHLEVLDTVLSTAKRYTYIHTYIHSCDIFLK